MSANSDVSIKRLQEQNLSNQNVIQGLTALQMSLNNRQLQNEINAFPKRLKAELNEAYARAFSAYASGKASLSQCSLNFKLAVTETLKQRGIHYDNNVKLRSINSLVQTAEQLWQEYEVADEASKVAAKEQYDRAVEEIENIIKNEQV